ncbi:MAG: bifunctional 4-hydroxy-2-oxoglutarate aldolase/2-dehydro-3-deoxy-phosphogluconate aldolase [Bacteroidota bacterium]
MPKFSRIEVASELYSSGLMPLFYHPDLAICKAIVHACHAGGIRLMEFTNRGDFAHLVYGQLRQYLHQNLPDMILGIGSVVDGATSSLYIQLGADFVVSPILNKEMALACNRRKVMWGPGCATLSEINQAEEWGAELVKIFPAGQIGGPAFIKAVKGPCPWSSIMPTGGVSPEKENLKAWFSAGAACVGMGSKLVSKDIVARQAWDELSGLVESTLQTIKEVRA